MEFTKTQPAQEVESYELTDEDIDYIDAMAVFYCISRDEAYQRFLTGNIDGLEWDEAVEEDEF